MSSTNISAGQELWLIGPDNLAVPVECELDYRRDDPYAVRLSLDTGSGDPVRWYVSRDLLTAALHGPEGLGDIRAWPSPAGSASPGKTLNIELCSPDGYARFEASAAGVGAFLARTFELVPGGQESDYLNLEAELAALLSQA
jgi:hypothetical protein